MKPYIFKSPLRTFSMPEDAVASLQRYVNEGIPTGSFLRAVLANDLMEAVGHADAWNIQEIPAYASYIYNNTPRACHGSYETVDAWIAHRGLKGEEKLAESTSPASSRG